MSYAIFPKRIEYILFPWLESEEDTGSFATKINLYSGVQLGEPLVSEDGRTAYNHSFAEQDVAYLQNLGATMAEALPEDWVYPTTE